MMIARHLKSALAMLAVFGAGMCGGCRSTTQTTTAHKDIEQAQFASAANAAFERGRIEEAESLYRRQLIRALAADDAAAISDADFNVAVCLIRRNKPAEADAALLEAERESRRAGMNATDIVLLRAVTARMQRRYADAIAFTEQVVSEPGTTSAQRVQSYVIAGLSRFDLGAINAAADELEKARREASRVTDSAVLAGIAELAGRIDENSGHFQIAANHYDDQARLLNKAGLYRDMSEALQRAGAAYRKADAPLAAADRFYRSARSFAAQGDSAAASAAAHLAVESALISSDAETLSRVSALNGDLAATTQASKPASRSNITARIGGNE